jgi:para-aminobenzoate synthetase/4-amino-4-deoxychorismate lyase
MSRVHDVPRPDPAHGLAETLLVLDGAPVELTAHLARLRGAARDIYRADLPNGAMQAALEGASQLELGRLRLTAAPRACPKTRARASRRLTLNAAATAIDPGDVFPSWQRAVALQTLVVPDGLGMYKWADRGGLALAQPHEGERSLRLLLDTGEEVLEASRANVFAVEHDALITPEADGRILPGIARERVIEIADALGIRCREQPLALAQLLAAGQAFLTGSIRGIEPVKSVNGVPLSRPGQATLDLAAELRRAWLEGSCSLAEESRNETSARSSLAQAGDLVG